MIALIRLIGNLGLWLYLGWLATRRRMFLESAMALLLIALLVRWKLRRWAA
jgi:hypothetical protein